MMEAVAGFALLLIIAGSLVRRAQRKTVMQDEQVRQMLRSTSGRTAPGAVIPYTYPRVYASKSEAKRVTMMQAARQRDEAYDDWKRRDLDPVFIPSFHQDYSMGLDMANGPDVSPTDFAGFAGGESGGAGGGSSCDAGGGGE